MSQRIGILGGMFDPVHSGHLHAACVARQHCRLDRILMLPCGNPVHREQALTSCTHRAAMLQLIAEHEHWFEVDLRECEADKPSRTHDTLASLRHDYPSALLCFIMGLDSLLQLPQWYRWRELPELANLVVIARPGYELSPRHTGKELWQLIEERRVPLGQNLIDTPAGSLLLLEQEQVAASSTEVRELLAQGKDCSELLHPAVLAYIEEHKLYRQS